MTLESSKITLNSDWTIKHPEKGIEIKINAPLSVFDALISQKIIEDPFYGENEHKVAWVYESDWIFEKQFSVSPDFLSFQIKELRFAGLDTYMEIFLNDTQIGTTNNMFREFKFNVNKILQPNNQLKIICHSPTATARAEIKKHKFKPISLNLPGVAYLRKAQYSFGWDWGPRLPDMGIWQDVELLGWNDMKIEEVISNQTFKYNQNPDEIKTAQIPILKVEAAEIIFNIGLNSPSKLKPTGEYELKYELKDQTNQKVSEGKIEIHELNLGFNFTLKNPQLWWTHDLGTPYLYTVSISLYKNSNLIDQHTQSLGIRELLLIRKPDKWGETFYFRLNGIPLFAKGADWIPVDSFIPRGRKIGLYEMNLNAAKEANMNMLRVWGGGIYEDNLFYDLCDKLGIILWQDFMFACAGYNATPEFLENISIEASYNIKRLRHHPSMALWCGNNEIEMQELMYLGMGLLKRKFGTYYRSYRTIFEDILPKIVKELDPQRPYWPSSPSNGAWKEHRGPLTSNSANKGDSHYWMVWHGGKPFTAYRKFNSRFMSEYGFESFPVMRTLSTFCPPDQFQFLSPIMKNHQKNPAGNGKIMNYMRKRFSIPPNFEQQVMLSQITQGEAVEYGIEHWRRNRNDYHCMASLYWQLNDCWPVASWASLDYYGRWKALHYFAKRNYAPVVASVEESQDQIKLWIVNDLKESKSLLYRWSIEDSEGKKVMYGEETAVVEPCCALCVKTIQNFAQNGIDIKNHFVKFALSEKDQILAQGFRFLTAPKDFIFEQPQLQLKIEPIKSKTAIGNDWEYEITISTDKAAFYIHLEIQDADFIAEDNFVMLGAGESRKIKLRNYHPPQSQELHRIEPKKVQIRSLFDLLLSK